MVVIKEFTVNVKGTASQMTKTINKLDLNVILCVSKVYWCPKMNWFNEI